MWFAKSACCKNRLTLAQSFVSQGLLMHNIPEIKAGKGIVIPNLADPEYRAYKALSQSALKEFAKSPRHYAHSLAEQREPTPALLFGQAFHAMMAVVDDAEAKPYAAMPKVDGRTKEGKAIKEQFMADNAGAIIVSDDDAARLAGMKQAALAHGEVRSLLDECNSKELSLFAQMEGVLCKGRFDMLSGSTIVDWKTIDDASQKSVSYSIREYRYDLQDSFYTALARACDVEVRRFVFVFIEKKPPHGIALYSISARSLEKANKERLELIKNVNDCNLAYKDLPWQDWPSYSEDIIELEIWP